MYLSDDFKAITAPTRSRMGSSRIALFLGAAAILASGAEAHAQDSAVQDEAPTVAASAVSTSALPDAPGFAESPAAGAAMGGGFQTHVFPPAGPHDKYIEAGQQAPHLTASNKFVLGVKDALSVNAIIGWGLSAGYSQIVDSVPNYENYGSGFPQRLGASAARAFSEGFIGDSIIAPLVHQDPRYYKAGPGHNFIYRASYAASRAIVTRTDGGHLTFNVHGIGGDAAGSALTNLYYPSFNRNFSTTVQTFGGSVGGDVLGYLASEFLPGILSNMHLAKKQ